MWPRIHSGSDTTETTIVPTVLLQPLVQQSLRTITRIHLPMEQEDKAGKQLMLVAASSGLIIQKLRIASENYHGLHEKRA